MTPELAEAISAAATLAELEDLYRPYKPKRKTRASVAKEKGLEPLAKKIYEQKSGTAPEELAPEYINEEKGVRGIEDALKGASDIIAEDISDNADIRRRLRNLFSVLGIMTSKAKPRRTAFTQTIMIFRKRSISLRDIKFLQLTAEKKRASSRCPLRLTDPKHFQL